MRPAKKKFAIQRSGDCLFTIRHFIHITNNGLTRESPMVIFPGSQFIFQRLLQFQLRSQTTEGHSSLLVFIILTHETLNFTQILLKEKETRKTQIKRQVRSGNCLASGRTSRPPWILSDTFRHKY